MTYWSPDFYPFHLGVFHIKIIVSLWLIYCFLVSFVMLASLIVEPILAHKVGKVIFRIVAFGSVFQQSGIRAWLFGVFMCAKMDDDIIKLNSLNYSTGSI